MKWPSGRTDLRSGRLGAGDRAGWLVPGLIVALACACVPGKRTAEEAIERFVIAVQSEDFDALYCLLAGASQPRSDTYPEQQRADFDAWARSRYEAYRIGRDNGGEELGEEGILLVKTFTLGKGTYYSVESVRYGGRGRLRADMLVRFGYGQVNYAALSPGTTFYLAADPPGRIAAIRIPYETREVNAEVLETLRVRWELARVPATPACPAAWAVASVAPVPGSETTLLVTWTF